MKVILDNIKLSDQRAGGVSSYWCELIDNLLKNNADVKFIEHHCAQTYNIFRSQLNIDRSKIIPDLNLPIKILRYLPVTKKIQEYSIFHSSYYRFCTQKKAINITTVHDFTYEKYKKGLPLLLHRFQKKQAILNSRGIICVSNNTKKDLLEYYPSIPETNIAVIYHGISDDYQVLSKNEITSVDLKKYLKNKYILYVGDRAGYKNFNVALDALHGLTDYHLTIVGGSELSSRELILLNEKVGKRYHHLTGIDNVQLNILFNYAFCMIYPSCYEGFGMPVAEAMKAGCPVVTTRTSSIPEVGGDAVLMVDSIKPEDFIEKIKLLENDTLRREMKERGLQRSKLFSWEKMYKETIAFYERIYAKYAS